MNKHQATVSKQRKMVGYVLLAFALLLAWLFKDNFLDSPQHSTRSSGHDAISPEHRIKLRQQNELEKQKIEYK